MEESVNFPLKLNLLLTWRLRYAWRTKRRIRRISSKLQISWLFKNKHLLTTLEQLARAVYSRLTQSF